MKGWQERSEMQGGELAKAIATVIDHLVNAQESTYGLDRAIETVVTTTSQFNGRDTRSYLEAYKAKILMQAVLEDRRLNRFSRVVTLSVHVEVLEIQ